MSISTKIHNKTNNKKKNPRIKQTGNKSCTFSKWPRETRFLQDNPKYSSKLFLSLVMRNLAIVQRRRRIVDLPEKESKHQVSWVPSSTTRWWEGNIPSSWTCQMAPKVSLLIQILKLKQTTQLSEWKFFFFPQPLPIWWWDGNLLHSTTEEKITYPNQNLQPSPLPLSPKFNRFLTLSTCES